MSRAAESIAIDVAWRLRRNWQAEGLLRQAALEVARAEGFRGGWLSIAVVGSRAMASVHERFVNIAGATDVLTFDLGTERRAGWIEGEVIVCADVAWQVAVRALRDSGTGPERAAAARVRPVRPATIAQSFREGGRNHARILAAARAELVLYLVHGVLHLAGYDDLAAQQAGRMYARQERLMQRLGLPLIAPL